MKCQMDFDSDQVGDTKASRLGFSIFSQLPHTPKSLLPPQLRH